MHYEKCYIVHCVDVRNGVRPCLHETGTKSNRDENFHYVHVRRCENHKSFRKCIPLARHFLFWPCFVSMHCSEATRTAGTGLKCICVYILSNGKSQETNKFFLVSTISSQLHLIHLIWGEGGEKISAVCPLNSS
jgi:hypothetical protein